MTGKCNICGAPSVHRENTILYINGAEDLEQYDWCILCHHCIRGTIKQIKEAENVIPNVNGSL